MDTTALIESTLAAEAQPLNILASRKTDYQNKTKAIEDLEQRFAQLQSAIGKLDTVDELKQVAATSSNKDVATVSAGDGAAMGSHTVEINKLATSERRVHAGLASAETLVGAGTFTYSYNGVERTVVTSAETTLEELKNLINNDADNPGVTASLLEYTAGVDQNVHLVLQGQDSGADYGISMVNTDPNALAAFTDDEASFLTTQTASNSQVRIDGYPTADWIERSSNSLSDLIPGVTVTLQNVGTTNLNLARKTGNIEGGLQNVVDVYNGLKSAIDAYTGYDEETGKSGVLQGDTTLNSLLARIRQQLVGSVDGFVDGQDGYTLVSQLGLSVDRYGEMSLDKGELNEALNADYSGVLNLIGAVNSGATWNSTGIQFTSATDDTQAGKYDVKVNFDGAGNITDAWIKLQSEADTEWRAARVNGTVVTGANGNPEEDMKLNIAWDGASAQQTAEVRVQGGFAGNLEKLLDQMLDAESGALGLKRTQFSDAIDAIEGDIENKTERLKKKEEMLREKYARLEATLAEMDAQRAQYTSMFSSLSKNSGGSGSK
ncbi:MAG: flagellar filament capping protein FliD [Phycisphaerae bacterium]